MNTITGNGSDDTAQFQQAINDLTTTGGRINLVGAIHLSEINLTNRHSLTIEGDGCGATEIYPLCASNSILDLSGSYYLVLRDLKIGQSGQTVVPKCAILTAQNPLHQSNRVLFDNIQVDGYYSVAAWYDYGLCSSTVRDSAFWNYNNAFNYTVTHTGGNLNGMISSFITLATGQITCGDINSFGTEYHAMVPAGSANNYPLRLHGTSALRFWGGNISGSGSELVTLNGDNNLMIFDGTSFYSENLTAPGNVFSNLGTVEGLALRQCAVPPVSGAVFGGPGTYVNATQS